MADLFSEVSDPIIPCNECGGGRMKRRYVAYITWLGEEMIIVPDFPAWVCDVCGRREYDMAAMTRLSLLLSPNAGQTPERRVRPAKKKPSGKGPRARAAD